MRPASHSFGQTDTSPPYPAGDASIAPTVSSSASASGSDAEDGGRPSNAASKRRQEKRSVKISCESCKARKVRCDRGEPACGWCARNNRICVYKERKRPEFHARYGKELEEKINRVEALLNVLGRRLEDHIDNHDISPQTIAASQPPGSTPTVGVAMSSLGEMTPAQDISATDSRWPNASYDRLQYSRAPDAMSIHSVVETGAGETWARPDLPTPTSQRRELDPGPAPSDSGLPPYELTYTLVDLYFKHVNPWCPILDRGATFAALFQSSSIAEPDLVLLHAIIVTTMRFSDDPKLTPESRKQYHDASKAKVQQYGLMNANVRALQALVILTVDVLGGSNDPEGWTLLGLIAQNITHLGLGVERNVFLSSPAYASISTVPRFALSQPKSWIEDEERRRLYWMVYVLDRYASLGTSFDFVLDDKESTRSLPCRYDLFSRNEPVETRSFRWPDRPEMVVNMPENLGSFSYHCEVLRILSRIHQFLRKPVDIANQTDVQRWRTTYRDLDSELNTWIQGLPGEYGRISQLCHSDPASRVSNWIMLHAAYVTSVLRLHSSFAYPIVRSQIFQPSYHAIQRCLGAVQSLREIAQDAVNTGMLDLLGHPFAFSLWVSARLLLVHAADNECEIDPMIYFFMSTLDHLGQSWPVARNYAEILNRVVQDSQQGETAFEVSRTLNGMRRSSYDLSTDLSKRPRSALEPYITKTPSASELECLEVFEFFHYPRLAAPTLEVTTPATTVADSIMGNSPSQSLAQDLDRNAMRDSSASMSVSTTIPVEGFIFKPPHE